MTPMSLEEQISRHYATLCQGETDLFRWEHNFSHDILFVANGFEDRARTLLKRLSETGAKFANVVVGTYGGGVPQTDPDAFTGLARSLLPPGRPPLVFDLDLEGRWVARALSEMEWGSSTEGRVILDISGLSQGRVFSALDAIDRAGISPTVAYTEAAEYWPRKHDWDALVAATPGNIPALVDSKPWLFSYEHSVSFASAHEGYATGVGGVALLAFLPFKSARLASILHAEDYAEKMFVVGRPRLDENAWRLQAQVIINRHIMPPEARSVELPTFGYRGVIEQLADVFFGPDGMAMRHDVHIAATGSKMQAIAVWTLSSLYPFLAIVLSVPGKYYAEAYSRGSGRSWLFDLPSPRKFLGEHYGG